MSAFTVTCESRGRKRKFKTKSEPKKSPAQLQQETDSISLMQPVVDNPARMISKDIYAYFGVRHAVDATGAITKTYYPGFKGEKGKVTGYKERVEATKEFYAVGDFDDVSLFGVQQALASGASRVFITAGEEDAIALWAAIWEYQVGGEFEGNVPAVVSLPYGDGKLIMTKHDKALIDNAKSIIILPDQDEYREESLSKLLKFLPAEKVLVADTPLKDASDMRVAGRSKELAEIALFRGQPYRPATIVTMNELIEDLTKVPEVGLPWPFQELTDLTYGIQPGKIYGIGGGVGSSKTLFCHMVMATLVAQGHAVGGIMLEETATECARDVAGIIDRKIYNRPDVPYNPEDLTRRVTGLNELLTLARDGEIGTVEQCIELVKYQVMLRGARVVLIDPISDLVAGLSASEGNEAINKLMKTLEKMAMQLGFSAIVTSHLNPPKRGVPHEEGQIPSLVEFSGSRGLMRKAAVCFGIARNAKATDGTELFNQIIRLKGRGCNPAAPGEVWTKFDIATGRMETTTAHPKSLIQEGKEDGGQVIPPTSTWGAQKKEQEYVEDLPW